MTSGAHKARTLYVFGAGGQGRVIADAALASGWAFLGFIDEQRPESERIWGYPIFRFGALTALGDARPFVALGIGDNAAREKVYARVREAGFPVATVIHPTAAVSPRASLGEGTVVFANAVVNPDARCGVGVIVNSGAIIEHDCVLEDFVHVSPNGALGGGVSIGARTHVGIGASVLPRVKIGRDVRVGGGAAVIRDVSAHLIHDRA